jgi:hypothetical protein
VPVRVGVSVQVTMLSSPIASHLYDSIFVRLDFEDLTIHGAPIAAQIETVIDGRMKIVLHQPFLDQVRLRQRA